MNRDNKLPFPEKLSSSDSTARVTNNNNHHNQHHLSSQTTTTKTNNKGQALLTATYQPTDQDILCGRGRGSFLHEGNKVYIALLRQNIQAYLAATKRVEKSVIIGSVVSTLKEQGFRFLKQDQNEHWYELTEPESYQRTAHAIRDLIRRKKTKPIRTGIVLGGPTGENNNKKQQEKRSRSPSQSNHSDISFTSYNSTEKKRPSKPSDSSSTTTDTPFPVFPVIHPQQSTTAAVNVESSSLSSAALNVASLPCQQTMIDTAIPSSSNDDDDSFDERLSEIPTTWNPTTTRTDSSWPILGTAAAAAAGFDVFYDFDDPNDFGKVLSQLYGAEKKDE